MVQSASAATSHRQSNILVRILAIGIGVGPPRHPDVREALRAKGIARVLGALIVMKIMRLIRQRFPASRAHGGGRGATNEQLGASPCPSPEDAFPRVIFQTWKSKHVMPPHFARWSETFRQVHPQWAYLLWDDADNRRFIETHYPWFIDLYDAYPQEIYRADAVRYFFLYHFGGLYADMDTQCIRGMEAMFESGDVWLGRMGQDCHFPHSIPNAMMAARRRQEFWLIVIAMLVDNAHAMRSGALDAGPATVTGPILLKKAFDFYAQAEPAAVRSMVHGIASRLPPALQPEPKPSNVVLLPAPQWYPLDWTNIIHLRFAREAVHVPIAAALARWLFPRSHLVTYWTHSW